jgi:Uma2 family endonuclease
MFFNWVVANGEGEGFDSSTVFRLPNGAERSPDVTWVRRTTGAPLSVIRQYIQQQSEP